jgi:ABC-type uncharacterized transport system involved in gliding motility auxiliary subunit
MTKRSRAAAESVSFLLVIGGILVALNVLALFVSSRFDATDKQLFSLSSGSKDLAKKLTADLEITAYFTADLPPPFNATERYLRDLLAEYQAVSKGRIKVTFVDPDTDSEKEQASKDGVQAVKHQVFENDGVSVKEGYRGMVMKYLDSEEQIPVIEDTAGLEYLLTTRIKKLVGDRTKVGVLSGHEESTTSAGLSALARCLPTYDFQEVTAGSDISKDLKALLVVAPAQTIPPADLARINKYVMEGGSLGVFAGNTKVTLDQQSATVTPVATGLTELLKPWGVEIKDGIVADAQCSRAPARGPFGMQIAVPHPPVPIVSFGEDAKKHPALFKLDSSPLPFTAPLAVGAAPAGATLVALASSSEQSWLLTGDSIDIAPREPREWQSTQSGAAGPFALMAAIEGKLPSAFPNNVSVAEPAGAVDAPDQSTVPVRVFVAGGAFFMRDEAMPPPNGQDECPMTANVALALNAVDWLTQDSDLVAVRAKNVEDPAVEVPLDVRAAEEEAQTAVELSKAAQQTQDVDQAKAAKEKFDEATKKRNDALEGWNKKKSLYRWGNMIGIPLVFVLFGVVRWQLRQRRRKNVSL